MAKSSKSRPKGNSQKPYPEFPLTAQPSGQWCKKRKGKQFYFGPIEDWQKALERYKAVIYSMFAFDWSLLPPATLVMLQGD